MAFASDSVPPRRWADRSIVGRLGIGGPPGSQHGKGRDGKGRDGKEATLLRVTQPSGQRKRKIAVHPKNPQHKRSSGAVPSLALSGPVVGSSVDM